MASSSHYDASPNTIVGSPHLRLGKFAFRDAKRLFRQHRPTRKSECLFDHLVGAGKECLRHGDAERLSGLEVDYKLELCDLLHR
jgi:hypothetical protein